MIIVVFHYVAWQLHGLQHLQAWILLSIWVKVFVLLTSFLIEVWQLRERRLDNNWSWLTWLAGLDIWNFVQYSFYVASLFILVNQINDWLITRRHKGRHLISEWRWFLIAWRFRLMSSAGRFDSVSFRIWCDWILPLLTVFIMFWILKC